MPTVLSLKPNPTFTSPVKISTPGGDAAVSIDVTFKHQRKTEFEAWLKLAKAQQRSDSTLAQDVVVGWSGPDADFTPEALTEFLDEYHSAGTEMVRVYLKQLAGIDF